MFEVYPLTAPELIARYLVCILFGLAWGALAVHVFHVLTKGKHL